MKTQTKIIVDRSQFQMEKLPDEFPDTSWIGEYKNTSGPEDKTIDRQERGDMGRNEFRYFIATMSGEDTGNADSVEQDYSRMEALNSGQWSFIGIRASVELSIPHGDSFIMQTIESPGLWGIEDDSGDEYLQEVYQDECNILADMLDAMGIEVKGGGK